MGKIEESQERNGGEDGDILRGRGKDEARKGKRMERR